MARDGGDGSRLGARQVKWIAAAIALVVVLVLVWPFYSVPTGSRGVVTQFGRIVGIENEGLAWDGKTCKGKLLTVKFAGAKAAASGVGKGWRIPSREELVGLVDMTKKKPRIDPLAFPGTPSAPFWATKQGSTDDLTAWLVSFANGKVRGNLGEAKFPLRLVRSGS